MSATGITPQERSWTPCVAYPLQPAPHFAGRTEILTRLSKWATDSDTSERVVALVAAGGTGKTAIAERVLNLIKNNSSAGVFVWSFYENPKTEEFLAAACEYFSGTKPSVGGGVLESLQHALTGTVPHLLILDGLERVQEYLGSGGKLGELRDPLTRRLVRWLAAGLGTRVKALITSRFPITDLAEWDGRGFRGLNLDDLEEEAAFAVLRSWGVKGNRSVLRGLLKPFQDGNTRRSHALTTSVLGSYIGKLWDGDASKAPVLDASVLAAFDRKAAKLEKILKEYSERLPVVQRDLLARLAVFPRNVTLQHLGFLIEAGGAVAGSLAQCDEVRLRQELEELRKLGLVFRYQAGDSSAYSAHPFLRESFGRLLSLSDTKSIHETMRVRLAANLTASPTKLRFETDSASLSIYEAIIDHLRLSGDAAGAFDYYESTCHGHYHLGRTAGEYSRGYRILSGFFPKGISKDHLPDVGHEHERKLVRDFAFYAMALGNFDLARNCLNLERELHKSAGDESREQISVASLIYLEILSGNWAAAKGLTTHLALPKTYRYRQEFMVSLVKWGCGDPICVDELVPTNDSCWDSGIYPAISPLLGDCAIVLGKRAECSKMLSGGHFHTNREDEKARSQTIRGCLELPDRPAEARRNLEKARSYANRSGNIEVSLRCHRLAIEIYLNDPDIPKAIVEALSGIQLADSCGFGRWSIDIRIDLARVHIAAHSPGDAIAPATRALELCERPESQFAWGIADSLHILGVAHSRLGATPKAKDYLKRALQKRRELQHPGLPETEMELHKILAKS